SKLLSSVPPGSAPATRSNAAPLGRVCADCGNPVTHRQRRYCPDCWPARQAAAGLTGSTHASQQLVDEQERAERGSAIAAGKRRAKLARVELLGWRSDDWDKRIAPYVGDLTLKEIVG